MQENLPETQREKTQVRKKKKNATVRLKPTVFRIHVPVAESTPGVRVKEMVAEAELVGSGPTPGVGVKGMVGLLLPKLGGRTPGGRDVTVGPSSDVVDVGSSPGVSHRPQKELMPSQTSLGSVKSHKSCRY
jgi:hypothetical protein